MAMLMLMSRPTSLGWLDTNTDNDTVGTNSDNNTVSNVDEDYLITITLQSLHHLQCLHLILRRCNQQYC